jgi:Putative peptidoglycan binding domain
MKNYPRTSLSTLFVSCLLMAAGTQAAMTTDQHGNVGYDTAAECDAAVASGTAKFYQPFTSQPPLKRAGEASVKQLKLSDLTAAQDAASALGYNAAEYNNGSCDIGVGRSNNRDGVTRVLIGKYIPYAPSMSVNVYFDNQDKIVRATMMQCDNNFGRNMPRPVGAVRTAAVASSATECFANVLTPARFETRTEQVIRVPATKRLETVPATFKTVTEQVLVSPELKRQIPVPATYKTETEQVVVRPESFREEPVAPTYKSVSERVLTKAESKRIEVIPATYKSVTEQVLVTPERKELRVIPAQYTDTDETVIDRPASTRVETIPATYKTETEQVLARAESLRYEPILLPTRRVSEEVLRSAASSRLETSRATYTTVTERVVSKEASKRLVEVPAVYETVTERIKVSDATREWKRGRAWIGQAINVQPLRGFVVGADGKFQGTRVEGGASSVGAAADAKSRGVVDSKYVQANNTNLDDDVMCLVEIPEQYQTISRLVVKTPASVREVEIPAEYATITRQVLDREAGTKEVGIPATYQTVTRQEIDIEKLKAAGYKFDDSGDIIATPTGERVLRASVVAAMLGGNAGAGKAGGAGAGGAAGKSKGAESGEEGYVREIKIPAEYRTATRLVIDRPASVRTVEVPATYKTVKSRQVASPARTEETVVPAVYRTVSRQVVDQAASSREIAIPAEYGTVERRVVETQASTRKIPVAAESQTISRRVVDTPASVREEVIPAVYRTVTRQVVDVAASTREIEIPAQMETLSRQVKVSDALAERRAVLCETNATPAKIMEIQRALQTAGYNPGPINGVLRAQTMDAVNKFQQSKNLPVDGFLNLDTVKALGVSPQ